MLCENCPLCVSDYNDYIGDGDIYCLVIGETLLGVGGCRRTNKFILSQNKQQLIDKLWEEEAEKWSEYIKQCEQEEGGASDA